MNSSGSSWYDFLVDSQIADQYFDEVPDLGGCDLFSVHIDERDVGLTLGVDLLRLPDKLLPEWEGKNFNAFTFFLTFTMIDELHVDGWRYTPKRSVEIGRRGERRIWVEIRGQGESVKFTADAIKMSGVRAYRASSVP
ncbi:Imm50 family immunity protein [Streptomyces sp. DSM 41527]|uniref:Imm50 family immunity protein n=1 Tax=Streptomyces mooreae TaxID=3075523 RepID=A0ABU2T423_9ACTN|nr:Imm50 family immunity protein [Streptomyces sp. DSM 41527]MDT0455983.1 Imm50 family immunity protein [Streptomyces sp. DSM 41527]